MGGLCGRQQQAGKASKQPESNALRANSLTDAQPETNALPASCLTSAQPGTYGLPEKKKEAAGQAGNAKRKEGDDDASLCTERTPEECDEDGFKFLEGTTGNAKNQQDANKINDGTTKVDGASNPKSATDEGILNKTGALELPSEGKVINLTINRQDKEDRLVVHCDQSSGTYLEVKRIAPGGGVDRYNQLADAKDANKLEVADIITQVNDATGSKAMIAEMQASLKLQFKIVRR